MTEHIIDLNADLGERPDALDQDAELMRYITSANVACGGHAGDEHTMRRTIEVAKELGVAIGAHPGYPDRENFGRTELAISRPELERSLREQIGALASIARELGVRLTHVKPHGALYHAAGHNAEVAQAIVNVVRAVDPSLILVAQARSQLLAFYREEGLRSAAEAFADRTYERDGSLRNRRLPHALHENPAHAARQAVQIALEHTVTTMDGETIPVHAETLCLHSDTPNSSANAREIREALNRAGVRVQRLR